MIFLLACATQPTFNIEKGEVVVTATVDVPVFDPKLDGATVTFTGAATPFTDTACALSTTLQNPFGQARTLADLTWDGRDDAGLPFDPGPWSAVVTATCDDGGRASTVVDGWIVRLAPVAIDFIDGVDPNIPLAYHKVDLVTRALTDIDAATPEWRLAPWDTLSEADEGDGTPRLAPAVWTNPDMPPWAFEDVQTDVGYNVPAAYAAGSSMRIRVTAASTATSARTLSPLPALPSDAPPLQLAVDGLTAVGAIAWVSGGDVEFDTPPLPDTLGRDAEIYTFHWQAQVDGVWVDIPGAFSTEHRIYRTAAPPSLLDGTDLGFAPPTPWIGTLEDLNAAVDGVPADPASVLDAIRDWIHLNDWIYYDPNDSSYSSYSGPYIYWEYTWSDLGDWLDRTEGVHLYCHSVSCLFSVLAGTEGVYAPQQVLGVGFTTNYVRAAGTDTWSTWGFNSHSVVSPDDGATLWDASIAMDGDGDPGNLPVTEVEPKGLSFSEYTQLLTADDIAIVNSGQCYVND